MTLEPFLLCLALNVYHEARSDDLLGQLAVALVTINRTKSRNKTICQVVYEPSQFSWTLNKKLLGKIPPASDRSWLAAIEVAWLSLQIPDFTGGAEWYHHRDIRPYWAKKKILLGIFGSHYFYRK